MKDHFVVAVCDEEILGKVIRKNPEFKVEKSFYSGKIMNKKQVVELMKRSTVGNLVGKRIIKLGLKEKFITKENVMFIGDVPHAQFIR